MGAKGQILVADDEKTTCDFLSRALTREGYKVFTAAEEKGVMEMVKTMRPDMVFLDLDLPDKGGLKVLRQIKKIDEEIPVILITDHGTIGAAKLAMRLGAHDFIPKPFEMDSIKAVLREVETFR